MSDPDARPIRKGKLRAPTEFGYVAQICEVTENTRRGARGLIVPVASLIGSPNESDLLPATAAALDALGLVPRDVALDGGFAPGPVAEHLPGAERVFIAGRRRAGSRRTDRRLARYRVGCEGRISHLKRSYGLKTHSLEGLRRSSHLDGLERLDLQPGHARRPGRLTASPRPGPHPPGPTRNAERPRPHPARPFVFPGLLAAAVLPGQVTSAACRPMQ